MNFREKCLAVSVALQREIKAVFQVGQSLVSHYSIPHTPGWEWGYTTWQEPVELMRQGKPIVPTQVCSEAIIAICQDFRFSCDDTDAIHLQLTGRKYQSRYSI